MRYFISMFVTALLFVGCSKNEIAYTPGEPENPSSPGVYFVEPASTNYELDPEAPTTLTFTAMRDKNIGAITVPVEVKGSEDGIFTVSEIKFEAEQTETEFTVSFPDAELGKSYTCEISVADPDYVYIYGLNNFGIQFSVTRVKWNFLGTGTFNYNGWWAGSDDTQELYQRDGTDLYRLPNWGGGITLFFTVSPDNKIKVDTQKIGDVHTTYGDVYVRTDGASDPKNYYDPATKTYYFSWLLLVYTSPTTLGSFGTVHESFVLDRPE